MKAQKSDNSSSSKWFILAYIILSVAIFVAILVIPFTRGKFIAITSEHPYLMGFIKFALLATAGELLAVRLAKGGWSVPKYIIARFVIWGFIGIWITYMMKIFGAGVTGLMSARYLPVSLNDTVNKFLKAFYISTTMNLCFGPTFMAVHKCSDTYLSIKATGKKNITLKDVITTVDWTRFVSFTLFKTVPLFWIPMHTLTFMLPEAYTVMVAAFLSMALGIILNIKKKAPASQAVKKAKK